jgi:hypothetical protein
LKSPVGTVVLTGRPVFRWQSVPGAQKYVVSLYDPSFQPVAESPGIASTEWQSEKPLAAGQVYIWQVTATVGDQTVRSPMPPAPEARFQVATADVIAAMDSARHDHGADHLVMAVMLAREGALDDAGLELQALASKDAKVALALQDSLQNLRK